MHSKTPWTLGKDITNGFRKISSPNSSWYEFAKVAVQVSGKASSEGEDNAAFIVRACNAHDSLVAALEDFINGAETNAITSDHDETFANLLGKARAAISLAREV